MSSTLRTRKIIIFIFTMTVIALIYVNQQALIYQIGLSVKENSYIYSKLVDRNKVEVYNVLNLKSPVSLETRLLAQKVELDMPRKWQIVKLNNSLADLVHKTEAKKRGLFANLFIAGREAEASPAK